jgi:TonB family protein
MRVPSLRAIATGLAVALLVVAAPVAAQEESPPQGCGVEFGSAQISRGTYAVLLIVTQPLDEVDLRLDDRNGHWLFVAKQPHVVITAPVTSNEVGLSVVGTVDDNGHKMICPPQGAPPLTDARAAKIRQVIGNPTPLQPTETDTDPPATCAVPFNPTLTRRLADWNGFESIPPGVTGNVQLRIKLDAAGSVSDVSVASSTEPRLNSVAIELVRRSQFHTPTFRCAGTPEDFLWTIQFDESGPVRSF